MEANLLRSMLWSLPNLIKCPRSSIDILCSGYEKSICICVSDVVEKPEWLYLSLGSPENPRMEKIVSALNENYSVFNRFIVAKSFIYKVGMPSRGIRSSRDVHILDIESGEWKKGPPMIVARRAPKIVRLGRNICVMGGRDNDERKGSNVWAEFFCEASKEWRPLPYLSPKFREEHLFTAASIPPFDLEDDGMVVVGCRRDKLLYRFHHGTHELIKLDMEEGTNHVPNDLGCPPVVVANKLIWFCGGDLCVYHLWEKWFCRGPVTGLDPIFLQVAFSRDSEKKLLYLGDRYLCLICLQDIVPVEGSSVLHPETKDESILHLFIFGVPEITANPRDTSDRSLHAVLLSAFQHKIKQAERILDAFLMSDEDDGCGGHHGDGDGPVVLPLSLPSPPACMTK